MSIRNQELYNIIESLPEELSNKVLEYIDYLKFVSITNNGPESLVIRNKEDLKNKLEEGIKDTESGNVCSIDDAFIEVEEMLAK